MGKFTERAKEPTTYAGLAAIVYGIGELFKVKEAAPIAETVVQAGEAVAQTGNVTVGIAGLLAGILAVFIGERKGGGHGA